MGIIEFVAYETNFKQKKMIRIYSPLIGMVFIIKTSYIISMHEQVLDRGVIQEEPMGPKGIVNRWADWLIKDLRKDVRGDHYFLMTIPYGKIMILTTDRP
jgi:hypothetical protein